jgi:hypothetical protein
MLHGGVPCPTPAKHTLLSDACCVGPQAYPDVDLIEATVSLAGPEPKVTAWKEARASSRPMHAHLECMLRCSAKRHAVVFVHCACMALMQRTTPPWQSNTCTAHSKLPRLLAECQ